jgi:hypothetical protein
MPFYTMLLVTQMLKQWVLPTQHYLFWQYRLSYVETSRKYQPTLRFMIFQPRKLEIVMTGLNFLFTFLWYINIRHAQKLWVPFTVLVWKLEPHWKHTNSGLCIMLFIKDHPFPPPGELRHIQFYTCHYSLCDMNTWPVTDQWCCFKYSVW